jgi:membrane protein YqaA with SNARE-associated domain
VKQKMLALARGPNALRALFGISFIESSVFPIPPDIMLIPMVLAKPERAWKIATVCTIASVLGGVFGYAIGMFAWETIGQPILEMYGKEDAYAKFKSWFDQWGFWAAFGAGLTPFPYKVITITSGAIHLNFAIFLIASVLSRGARFFLVAAVLRLAGERARECIEKYFGWLTLAMFALVLLGLCAVKLVH